MLSCYFRNILMRHRIIKDYYITQADPTKRPRIFGMTASPVDAREDVVKAARSGK